MAEDLNVRQHAPVSSGEREDKRRDPAIDHTPGLWRVVLARAVADWPLTLAAWLLLIAAITLLVAGTLYSETVAVGGLRRTVLSADPSTRTVVVRTLVQRASLLPTDRDVVASIRAALGPSAEVERVVHAGSLTPVGVRASDGLPPGLIALASYGGVERHASLDAGRWPRPGLPVPEAAITTSAAVALGLRVGDELDLAGGGANPNTLRVRIVGSWRPNEGDPYWTGGQPELDGSSTAGSTTTRGPLVIAEPDLLAATTGDLSTEWRGLLPLDAITTDGVASLRDRLADLPGRLRAQLPVDRQAQVDVRLAAILEDAQRSTVVSRGGIVLLSLQFAVLAGYAIILVAGVLLDSRRDSTALLRSRGAETGSIVSLTVAEAALLAGSAAMVSLPLAIAVVWAITRVGPFAEAGIGVDVAFSSAALLVAITSALVAAAALSIPTLASTPSLAGVRAAFARRTEASLSRRLAIDVVLLAVGAAALWQLRLYGTPLAREVSGSPGMDPIVVAAPALGLVAGSLLTVRIVPRLAELLERLLAWRGPAGIVAVLSGYELARRPSVHVRAVLLIVITVALGTFAATQGATWRRSQLDQATYEAVADVRVVSSSYGTLPAWSIGSEYRSLSGVRSATPATTLSASAGRAVREATLLALDARMASAGPPSGGDANGVRRALGTLADERPPGRAEPLPGTPRRLAIVLDADLQVARTEQPPAGWVDRQMLSVALVVSDADGRVHRFDAGAALPQGTDQRLEVAMGGGSGDRSVVPSYPVALEAIEIRAGASIPTTLTGRIDIKSVQIADELDASGWSDVALPGALPGWTWVRMDSRSIVESSPQTRTPNRLDLGSDAGGPTIGGYGVTPTIFRLGPAPSSTVIPAIASDRFLALSGAEVGDSLSISTTRGGARLRVIASTPDYAPLDPEEPFVVVDRQTLQRTLFAEAGAILDATEWWIETDPEASPGVASELRRPEYGATEVIARDELVHALTTDPIPLGVIGALGMGTVAAVLFTVIGFLVASAASARERRPEFAIVRGLGLSSRQLTAWLSLENASLVAAGLVIGTGLGLGLAWLFLPVSTFTPSGAATVPPPVVVVPWDAVVLLDLACVAVAAAAVAASTRLARSVPVSTVIRSLAR